MHDEHWTELEIQLLKDVQSFDEAAEIAICILGRMRTKNQEIVQICGPMSSGGLGSLSENMERFKRAVFEAGERGLLVFNQIPFQEAIIKLANFREGEPYAMDILEIFYRKIFESGHIHKTLFLEGWHTSVGARWERELVATLGIQAEEYPSDWLE